MKAPVLGHICCIKTERNIPERIQVSLFLTLFFFSKNPLTVAVCSEGPVILGFPLHDRRAFSFQLQRPLWLFSAK